MEWYEEKNKWFDCFEILGLDETASFEEIKAAYRMLVKMYHPDNQKTANIEEYRKVEKAYETLKDKEKREKYIAFSKEYKKKGQQEKILNFEDILKDYQEKEKQLKIFINVMIEKIEKKEQQFSAVYNDFCDAIKNKSLTASDFEIKKQKLRSVELSCLNAVVEINKSISELKNMNLDSEKEKLKKLQAKLKEKDKILTSSYETSYRKLKRPKVKKQIAFVPTGILIAGLSFANPFKKEIESENNIVLKVNQILTWKEYDEIKNKLEVKEDIISYEKLCSDILAYEKQSDCILFQKPPENISYDEMTEPYQDGFYEVRLAKKDGIQYLLDANTLEVLVANFFSHGPLFYEDGEIVQVYLGIDGYDYTLDATTLSRLIKVESAYQKESEPFYLEGYGEVIETYDCGRRYFIDAKTRYPLVKDFEDYSPLYYDEEFGCDVYCFTRWNNEKRYVQASDLKKVLKIENKE